MMCCTWLGENSREISDSHLSYSHQQTLVDTLEAFSQEIKSIIVDSFHRLDEHLEQIESIDSNMKQQTVLIADSTKELTKRKLETCHEMEHFW
jgi:16S rRNA C1402 (ribose-2'-O) methylase RsmI